MKMIVAVDRNWGIGKENKLLVHLPGDLKYFKEKTTGKVVVMGRKTLESMPNSKPLPNRINIVITRDTGFEAPCTIVHSFEELEEELKKYDSEEIFIIGGAQVYRDMLNLCDTVFVTRIYKEFDADCTFVNLDHRDEFEVVWESDMQHYQGIDYKFVEYRRI